LFSGFVDWPRASRGEIEKGERGLRVLVQGISGDFFD